jgi:hypothetical protein
VNWTPSSAFFVLVPRPRFRRLSTRGRSRRTSTTRITFAALVVLWLALYATAQGQDAGVRTSLDTKGDTWIGQRITLVVELLVPGYFSGTPSFDLPSVSGLLLIPPQEGPTVSSETQDGIDYSLQRHELLVIAQRGGDYTIPPITVRLSFKRNPLDQQSVAESAKTQPVSFTAKVPAGAEKLGSIISANDLTAEEMWKPQPGKAKVGDAFTRTVTFSATDVPGMAFPEFPTTPIDGLGVYPKVPQVLDKTERGELQGKRIQTITYVCETPGSFTIPAVQFRWFSLHNQQLETVRFPAQTLDVVANPAFSGSPEPTPEPIDWKMPVTLLLCAAALVALWATCGRWFHLLWSPAHLSPLNPGKPK